jgi:AcrR family transcriptional regulator
MNVIILATEEYMPPRQKFTKEDVLETAFSIVREQGIENLNARNIAQRLNSSTQPIFSFFENMAELKTSVFQMTERYHSAIYNNIKIDKELLANICLVYINFALKEPNLFRLQYQSNEYKGRPFLEIFNDDRNLKTGNERLCEGRRKIYGGKKAVETMFFDMWLYAHGIASVLVGNQLQINRDEIEYKIRQMAKLLEKNI